MSQQIQDYLVNIKTFQTYLDHIVNSIESDRYHEDTIKKLSESITNYYTNINENDNEQSSDDSDSDISIQGTKQSSDDSDSESDSSGIDYSNIFMKNTKKIEPFNTTDKYLDEFINTKIDNSDVYFYKKHPEFITRFNRFVNTIECY